MFLVMKTGCKPHEVFAERLQLAEQSEPQFPLSLRSPLCWWGGPILVGSTPTPTSLSSLYCSRNSLAFSKTFLRSFVSKRFFLKSTVRG